MLHSWPRWATTAAFGLLLAAGFVIEVAAVLSRDQAWALTAASLAITAAVCVAALFRRRFPAVAAAAAIGLCAVAELIDWRTVRAGQPAPVACLALLVVVASAVRSLPAAGAVAAAAGSGIVAVGTVERYATYLEQGVPNARSATLVMVTGWAIATTIGVWRRLADTRRHTLMETVRRNERFALARDLHDVAAHHLTGLIIQAQVAQLATTQPETAQPGIAQPGIAQPETPQPGIAQPETPQPGIAQPETPQPTPAQPTPAPPTPARAALAEIEVSGTRALDALRQVVRLLREDGPPRPGSLVELVEGAGARFEGSLPGGLPLEVEGAVYRIVQEALTNVARHAKNARTVVVTLDHSERGVRVRVADDGELTRRAGTRGHGLFGMRAHDLAETGGHGQARSGGHDQGGTGGHGLVGMRERVEALGGEFGAGPGETHGWTVTAVLPVRSAA